MAKVTKNKDRNKDNRLEKVFIDLNKLNENKIVKVYENQDEILILANETKIKHSFII